ncbi:gas vesicle protein GvpO [Mycobacterium sp. ITM-2016-00318]|uniref:gas vesicle protein GvpO n=1 Tax=Mycobacterium sp. ITM-2016-00318 TaxID=2099693 RepID=UPI000CF91BC1|nr:gas vesicle protein GvpO [Mycobacterium sp. ITM-2016-00318]WNG91096.1 gas vesicle protein GvpO [Mycobacterium sp. ITM-2016-00318]
MTKRSPRSARVAIRKTVELAADYVTDITNCQPTQVTALQPADEGGWIVEVEVVAERRIPSSADMLELYEIELDADGEVLAHNRISRYARFERLPNSDAEQSVN